MKKLTEQEIAERNAIAQKILDKILAEDRVEKARLENYQKRLESRAVKPLSREDFDLVTLLMKNRKNSSTASKRTWRT